MQFEIEEAEICALLGVVDIAQFVCDSTAESGIIGVPELRLGRGAIGHLG